MEFFTVWWYDLLLLLALGAETATFLLDRRGAVPVRNLCVGLTVLLELALVLCMLVVGGNLTDLLIVLMLCALGAAALAALDRCLDTRAAAFGEAEGEGVDGLDL